MTKDKKGWISLLKNIDNHWLWRDKPFAKGQAWVDMLLMANYEPKKWIMGNVIVPIERGQFVTSQKKLADRWGWGRDRQKVRDFLTFLENPAPDEPMITKETTKLYTKITILNYNKLQQFEPKTPATENQAQNENKLILPQNKTQAKNQDNYIGLKHLQQKRTKKRTKTPATKTQDPCTTNNINNVNNVNKKKDALNSLDKIEQDLLIERKKHNGHK